MDSKLDKTVRGRRLTPSRAPEEQRRLGEAAIAAMKALAREAKRNGMTPAKAKALLREIREERKAKRRAR
ncbi:MAG: hypothetical protein KIT16_20140 [Rhodospirillaceae bacterium]|nr:hypothetical protein [Rhodospirillaceae bacterium]